jgi:hypothetical protein
MCDGGHLKLGAVLNFRLESTIRFVNYHLMNSHHNYGYNGLDLTDKLYTDKYMCFHGGIFVINNYTSLGYF